ncbi:MAG TPA: FHA domain-containing protein [Isosphaeraceae bacterium]|nr:FHA domain-containing protein [Isosphaeraceae bacterium]
MVNPGGESTMLGHWRIVLRQAEEAARVGRFEEAYALANRPDVADHHHVVQFRTRLALDLIARATRRGAVDDLAGAIEDLNLAERIGSPPDSLAAARLNLADRVANEVRVDLDAGEPARTLERIEELARHKISGPALRRTREIADAWQTALTEGRRGEFGRAQEQLDRAERLAGGAGAIVAQQAVAAAKVELENRQKGAAPKIEALYAALSDGKWPQILAAAEAVLVVVPEHPAARQARTRAWQQIAAIGPAGSARWPQRDALAAQAQGTGMIGPGSGPERDRDPGEPETQGIVWLNTGLNREGGPPPPGFGPVGRNAAGVTSPRPPAAPRTPPSLPLRPLARGDAAGPKGRFLLWVDAVGGYLVCLDDRIVLGRAGSDSHADIPLMGDLSRNHATLLRNGEGYLLQAHHASFVNGKPVVDQALLRDGDVIRLGSTVELEFRQPSPVSATARLAIVSRHRLPLAVDGVLLMAETCIVGAAPQAHIPAPMLKDPVVLYRQASALWCRAAGAFDVDGRTCAARAPLTLQSSVLGDGFSFSLEPLGSQPV